MTARTAQGADADVIIVGAGPAGAATALLLARAGHDVLIIDRDEFPRAKPCGDCLSVGASAVLHRLGLLQQVLELPHARLRGWRMVAPDGTDFTAMFDGSSRRDAAAARSDCRVPAARYGLAVERRHLDSLVLEQACCAGARFLGGARVADVTRGTRGAVTGVVVAGQPLHAPLVIGADGLRSIVAGRIGAVRRPPRLRKVSFTMHLDLGLVDQPIGEMHVGAGFCAGLAPLRRDASRCNLTIVADTARHRDIGQDPRRFARLLIDRLPHLRNRIPAGLIEDVDVVLASGPFDRPVRYPAADGVALVGDAAGYFDPFTGQGIFQALAGAERLADVADRALRSGDMSARALSRWHQRHRRLARSPRRVQHAIELVLARPRLADRVFGRLRNADAFTRTIIAVTGDVAPARRLLSPAALLSLILPA